MYLKSLPSFVLAVEVQQKALLQVVDALHASQN